MISVISNAGSIIADHASNGSHATSMVSVVKKAIAIITLNGLLSAKMKAAALTVWDFPKCAVLCTPNLPDVGRYAACMAECMANS